MKQKNRLDIQDGFFIRTYSFQFALTRVINNPFPPFLVHHVHAVLLLS